MNDNSVRNARALQKIMGRNDWRDESWGVS